MSKLLSYSFWRIIAINLAVTCALLLVLELGLRAVYYRSYSGPSCAIIQFTTELGKKLGKTKRRYLYTKPLFRPDPLLGYSCYPGRHEIGLELTSLLGLISRTWRFTAILDNEGYRTTSLAANDDKGKPEIWLCGCSYTWGWPLDNKDTFPFLLQSELSSYTVKNFAGPGYGTVHALLQLHDRFQHSKISPAAVIIAYNQFHLPRNVAAPSWMKAFHSAGAISNFLSFQHPKAQLADGILSVKFVPIVVPDEPEPSLAYMEDVAIAILDEIKKLCAGRTPLLILAVQTNTSFDRVVQHCARSGYEVIDMALPYMIPKKYQLAPFDIHPNPAAHRVFADKLMKGLVPLLQRTRK